MGVRGPWINLVLEVVVPILVDGGVPGKNEGPEYEIAQGYEALQKDNSITP